MSLFVLIASIVVLLLTSNRKSSRCKEFDANYCLDMLSARLERPASLRFSVTWASPGEINSSPCCEYLAQEQGLLGWKKIESPPT